MRIRHLIERPGAAGPVFYWQPSTSLRAYGWRPRRLPDDRAEAVMAAEKLNAEVDAWRVGELAPDAPAAAVARARANSPPRGSVAALVRDYRDSRFWTALAPRTQREYGWALGLILRWAGDQQARAITPPAVQAFYEGLHRRVEGRGKTRRVIETPARAAAAVRVLRLLLQVGVRLGYVVENAAARPGIGVTRQREPVLWSADAVHHMADRADAMGWRSIGTAILLNEWLGQRVADVLALPPWRTEDGALVVRQGKTGRRVALPLHLVPHLVERLQAERARDGALGSVTHLLLNDRTGQPWNIYAFDRAFADIRAAAAEAMPDCAGLQFRELRHTAVTRLSLAGVDLLGIAAITGHTAASVKNMLDRHYLIRTATAAENAFKARLKAERGDE